MNTHWFSRVLASRWLVVAAAGLLGLQLGAGGALAQSESSLSAEQKKKLKKELQQTYKEGAQAGNKENYEVAATRFEESVQLAQKLGLSDLVSKIENNLAESLRGAGSAALKQENYEDALSHFNALGEYTDTDPTAQYNQGLALINMEDSTEAGLQSLRRAIEIGNEVGNTRVAGLATERIQDEFLARASKALQGDNPSQARIDEALGALDQMTEYVDPNANAMFYRGTALYESGQYQQAVQAARQGLDLHQGSRTDAAKFHFVIAESQIELGDKASACQTFENAAYGDYEARANHYLENECDDV
ncbi:tetratricopeptide repeat protein [Salinibacter altiplanensis]|uniref:tetratricopeptide repeat protein n=1 Tax=Salinibacter altiplanensis TaxID=1803181 RepID=UPI000C9F22FE|nr:tetratricopeptide repeat protein [Salinibacter altiplanensis]